MLLGWGGERLTGGRTQPAQELISYFQVCLFSGILHSSLSKCPVRDRVLRWRIAGVMSQLSRGDRDRKRRTKK